MINQKMIDRIYKVKQIPKNELIMSGGKIYGCGQKDGRSMKEIINSMILSLTKLEQNEKDSKKDNQ